MLVIYGSIGTCSQLWGERSTDEAQRVRANCLQFICIRLMLVLALVWVRCETPVEEEHTCEGKPADFQRGEGGGHLQHSKRFAQFQLPPEHTHMTATSQQPVWVRAYATCCPWRSCCMLKSAFVFYGGNSHSGFGQSQSPTLGSIPDDRNGL